MENYTPRLFSNVFHRRPFQNLLFLMSRVATLRHISTGECKRNKFDSPVHRFLSLLCLQLLVLVAVTTMPVSGQDWDGVIVTQADYQSLQAFKHDLSDPKGFLKSWNDSGFGACSGGWVGIKCAQGQVIIIQLPWRGLGGRITEKIGQLQALRKLSLHDNSLGGSIPASLGFLPNLRGVQLFNNRLSGSIPPQLGSSPLLQTLDVSRNLLTGSIPATLANSTKLYSLNLSYNALSGSIPVSLSRSPSLTFLYLQFNTLSGSIPDSWDGNQNASQPFRLQSLILDNNLFTGSLPRSLGNLVELKEVSISHNQLSGPIPEELGKLSGLSTLDFSNNAFNGSLPSSLSNLSSLVSLNLENNHIPKS